MKSKIVIITGLIILTVFLILRPYYLFLTQKLKISPLKVLISKDSLKTFDNQVNIAVLGIPGGNHDGPNLSDSIIVANYNFKSSQLTTISIPRDIWSDTLRDKINTAYAYGEGKMTGGGLKLARAEISTIIGQPIHYAVVIDFSKFEQLIDFLGGIDIQVNHSFTDKKFPIPGKENDDCGGEDPEYQCRYETISFKKGLMTMDGKTALKFVRSRNAEGVEGNDFARESRQQKVIDALEKKLTSSIKKANLAKIDTTYQYLNQLVSRDITNQQLAIIGKNIIFNQIFGHHLSKKQTTLSEDFFEVPPYYLYDGKYVLIPKDKDFAAIHQFINCQINNGTHCKND